MPEGSARFASRAEKELRRETLVSPLPELRETRRTSPTVYTVGYLVTPLPGLPARLCVCMLFFILLV